MYPALFLLALWTAFNNSSWARTGHGTPMSSAALADLRIGRLPNGRAAIDLERVLVQNVGGRAGPLTVILDVLGTDSHQPLVSVRLSGPRSVPAAEHGGSEGEEFTVPYSARMEQVVDSLKSLGRGYTLRGRVVTTARDSDLTNNTSSTYSLGGSAVHPGGPSTLPYAFENRATRPLLVRWHISGSTLPFGWSATGLPNTTQPFIWRPGEVVGGGVTVMLPRRVARGESWALLISIVDAHTGAVLDQSEWYPIFDTIPPVVTEIRVLLIPDGKVAVELAVDDEASSVNCASVRGFLVRPASDVVHEGRAHCRSLMLGRPTLVELLLSTSAHEDGTSIRLVVKDLAGNIATAPPLTTSAYTTPRQAARLLAVGSPRGPHGDYLIWSFLELDRQERGGRGEPWHVSSEAGRLLSRLPAGVKDRQAWTELLPPVFSSDAPDGLLLRLRFAK